MSSSWANCAWLTPVNARICRSSRISSSIDRLLLPFSLPYLLFRNNSIRERVYEATYPKSLRPAHSKLAEDRYQGDLMSLATQREQKLGQVGFLLIGEC